MKNNFKKLMIISLAVVSLSIISCKDSKDNESLESMSHQMSENQHSHTPATDSLSEGQNSIGGSEVEFEDHEIAILYQNYIDIKQALIHTDAKKAQNSAAKLFSVLENEKGKSSMITSTHDIASSDNAEEQRQAFSELTKAIEKDLQKALVAGKIYKQYCPMAFEGNGSFWFSNEKEIRNPYFGEKMLTCGKVEATLTGRNL